MRKIINSTYITLDGVVEGPHLWPSLGRPGDERFGQIQADLVLSCDAMLMGRRTYDGFAPVWPTRSGDPVSDQFNAMPKYVVSTTLKDPEWNNTHVIDGDVVGEITRLKQAPGKDIVQYGFGPVSRLLLEHGLLDELRLWIHPVILGQGTPADLLFGKAPSVGFSLTRDAAHRRHRDPQLPDRQDARPRGRLDARPTPAPDPRGSAHGVTPINRTRGERHAR